jgi:hypothetical protein
LQLLSPNINENVKEIPTLNEEDDDVIIDKDKRLSQNFYDDYFS